MNKIERSGEDWHLDKKMPLAMIAAIAFQAAAVVWSVSGLYRDVEDHGARLDRLEIVERERATAQGLTVERLARIEERLAATIEVLREIKNELRIRRTMRDEINEPSEDRS